MNRYHTEDILKKTIFIHWFVHFDAVKRLKLDKAHVVTNDFINEESLRYSSIPVRYNWAAINSDSIKEKKSRNVCPRHFRAFF